MASVSDWARVIGTTIVHHLREEELAVFRKFKTFALLEKSGNVVMNCSGRGFDWNVRFRHPVVTGSSGDTPRSFQRQNLFKRAELPYRGATAQDAIFRREMLENRGQQALVNVAGGMAQRLQEGVEAYLAYQIYEDGNAVGRENSFHGLQSFLGYSGTINETDAGVATQRTANAADRFGFPDDNYAGLSTRLGAFGGGRISATGRWPEAAVDPELDFFSPVIVNYSSTAFGNSPSNTWKSNCVDATRTAIHHTRRNDTRDNQVDMVIMDRKLYIEYLSKLDSKERINVESNKLTEVGFTDTFTQDGVAITSEYSCPAGKAFGLSIGNMELRSLEDTLMVAEGPFYDEENSSYRYACSVLANFRCRSPRNFFLLDAIA